MVQNVPFASILAGIGANRYDVGASSFGDTAEREKSVDFVDYLVAGESFYTKVSSGVNIKSIADICGDTVSVETGTTEKDDATAQGKKCLAEGSGA
jgi:polar amino acid transport system substrate-binding protein